MEPLAEQANAADAADAQASYLEFFRGLAGLQPGADPELVLRDLQSRLTAFRMQYKFGMDEVLTKITILREEFEETHDYGPIEHVKTRLKSMDSLLSKMARVGCPPDLESIKSTIQDIAGIRITCAFVEDTYRVASMLTAQPDLTVVATKDYIKDPKPNGYQSLHLIVEVPVFLSDRTEQVPVELQIRTIAMDFWASVEHQIRYKYRGAVPDHLADALLSVAGTATELDRQMAQLREDVRAAAAPIRHV